MLRPFTPRVLSGASHRASVLRLQYTINLLNVSHQVGARSRTMATAHQIVIPATDTGLLKFPQDDATAAKVSELLQKDLENHHTFFSPEGFHNHIVHHLLSLYGTGAGVPALEKAYKDNASYQVRLRTPQDKVLSQLREDYASAAPQYLGKGPQFSAFLAYFQEEIDKKGWQDVIAEHLFADTETSRDLFCRLHGGIFHPVIQLMYGIEWKQPAIIASALAQTAVHSDEMGSILSEAENLANERNPPYVPFISLLEDLALQKSPDHEVLARSVKWEDKIKIRDGVMTRARQETIEYLSKIKVQEEDLEERTAEMMHVAAYTAASVASRPPHVPKFDFFLIHHLNASPVYLSFNKIPWLPESAKVRLLEWKMRLDVIDYIARGCPQPQPNLLGTYKPRDKTVVSSPEALLYRFHNMDDDGHIIKVARSLLIAQQVSKPYADREWICIKEDKEWLGAHYLLLDAVEGPGDTWVRATGFPEAWANVPEQT